MAGDAGMKKSRRMAFVAALWASAAAVPAAAQSHLSPAIAAARNGDLDALRTAIKKGADLNAVDSETGRTALMSAAAKGYVRLVEALVAEGADVNLEDSFGETALLDAAREGRADVVKVLVAAKARVDAKNHDGETPLVLAVSTDCAAAVGILASAGASVNAIDRRGWRPLMYAASRGHAGAAVALLAAGADARATASDGDTTALSLAILRNHKNVAALLKKAMDTRK